MIVIATTVPKVQRWLEDAFLHYAPPGSYCLAESEQAQFATTAVSWFPDLDQLEKLPALKLVHSMAAGVEHLDLARIATRYKVCRVVDELHQKGMFDYLQWGILYYQRFFDQAFAQKKQQRWRQYPQRAHADVKIGIMGLGQMGHIWPDNLLHWGIRLLAGHGLLNRLHRSHAMPVMKVFINFWDRLKY